MMIGIIILGAMQYIHGTCFPFKSNAKHHLELFLFLNLQILFVTSIYTTSNYIAVNTLVSLAFTYFVIFSLFRLTLHSKLKLCWMSLAKLHSKYFNRKQPQLITSPQFIVLRNMPPEVKYNYTEFREPLIGQDNM